MAEYTLSYVLTTYNKLPYLRQVIERLVAARKPDEEIVVADGGSKDGTPEYLKELFEAGKIQQFISERDKGEAHGFNKCMLLAKGELIKLITDDDAFCYPAIQKAKVFMLAHPEVDVLSGNTGLIHLENLKEATIYSDVADNYQRWMKSNEVIWMIGLPLLIRRTSLAITGLFHTGVVQVDTEFTYRITSLKVNIAWSTDMLSVRIENPQSNFRVMKQGKGSQISDEEGARMRYYYDKRFRNDTWSLLSQRVPYREWIKRPIRPLKRVIFDWLNLAQYNGNERIETGYMGETVGMPSEEVLQLAYKLADDLMVSYNDTNTTEFLTKTNLIGKVLPSK